MNRTCWATEATPSTSSRPRISSCDDSSRHCVKKRGPSVEERVEYGDLAKIAIRHLATREAAVADVAKMAATDPAAE